MFQMLMLSFTRFKLETSTRCLNDFVQIHDGLSMNARLIGRFCGTTPPDVGTLNTTHNVAMVIFGSDSTINFDGFQLRWQAADPGTTNVDGFETRGDDEKVPGGIIHRRSCGDVVVTLGKTKVNPLLRASLNPVTEYVNFVVS